MRWLRGMLVAVGMLLLSCGPNAAPRPTFPPASTPAPTVTAADQSAVLYALASADADSPAGFAALALPSSRRLGVFSDLRRQGGGFAIAPGGQRGYLLDGPYLHELELPSLKPIRSIQIDDALPMLGNGRVLAVSRDGVEVYVETMRIGGPQKWDAQLATGQPDSVYGIAVYDVAQGVLARRFDLAGPWCGVAELFALPDRQLAIFCQTAQNVRLVDPNDGREIARIGLGDPPRVGNAPGRAIASAANPDGNVLYIARDSGGLTEVDLVHNALARGVVLGGDGGQRVPYQRLHLSQDGTQLFVRAAIHQPDLRSLGIGDVVWVVDTSTLQRVAEVPLPAPAFDAAPTPDGRMLITSNTNTNTQDPNEKLPRLVDVPSGREIARWQGALAAMQTTPSVTDDADACTGTVVGRIAWGYFDHRPVADGPVRVADSKVSARTDAEGRFRLEHVPLGTHVGTLDHARFSFQIDRCGQTVDVGTVAYPLAHPDMQAMAAFDAFMHERFDRQGESPCWYREQIESVDETSPDRYVVVTRVFMHEWLDKRGSTPISRVYDVVVVRSSRTWQVESLGPGRDERQEPGEPGAATSACEVARQTPITQKGAPVAPPTSAPR